MHPIRNCRLWLLAAVVIILVAASSAASQVAKNTGGDPAPQGLPDTDRVLPATAVATNVNPKKSTQF